MKRIAIVILSLMFLVGMLVACSNVDEAAQSNESNATDVVPEVVEQPVVPVEVNDTQEQNLTEEKPVACTMDAKVCPDGSSVGRIAPDCEFAACPETQIAPVPVKETVSSKNKIHVVELRNATFSPEKLTIKVGDTVTWKNMRSGYYGRAMIVGSRQCREIRSEIFDSGETFSWTFTQPNDCTITDGFITYTKASTVTIIE
ncbi:hypothetical protein HYV86_02080 [Candidatus Woesearchaeota archaeon]|nr:hypothetical protein [Candidatus Woesearchaeota archaeon]